MQSGTEVPGPCPADSVSPKERGLETTPTIDCKKHYHLSPALCYENLISTNEGGSRNWVRSFATITIQRTKQFFYGVCVSFFHIIACLMGAWVAPDDLPTPGVKHNEKSFRLLTDAQKINLGVPFQLLTKRNIMPTGHMIMESFARPWSFFSLRC